MYICIYFVYLYVYLSNDYGWKKLIKLKSHLIFYLSSLLLIDIKKIAKYILKYVTTTSVLMLTMKFFYNYLLGCDNLVCRVYAYIHMPL